MTGHRVPIPNDLHLQHNLYTQGSQNITEEGQEDCKNQEDQEVSFKTEFSRYNREAMPMKYQHYGSLNKTRAIITPGDISTWLEVISWDSIPR